MDKAMVVMVCLLGMVAAEPTVKRNIQQYSPNRNNPYRPTPQYGGRDYDSYPPASYQYKYDVAAPEYGTQFGHQEARQGDVVQGRYYVLLPDGRTQVVEYVADQNGYRPKISYEGSQGHVRSGYTSGSSGIRGYAGGRPIGQGEYPKFGPHNQGGYSGDYNGQGGYPSGGTHSQGYPSGGYNSQGGYPSGGTHSQGYPSGGYNSQGGYPSGGTHSHGYPSGGYNSQGGYPSGGTHSQGYPSGLYNSQGGYPRRGLYGRRGNLSQGGYLGSQRIGGGSY